MQRVAVRPRGNWQKRCEALGFSFHSIGGCYWVENAAFEFSAAEVDALESATEELERLCLEAVDHVVTHDWFARLDIPFASAKLAKDSWKRQERNIVGRFDLHFDGQGPPKLYEYNADTPTALLEASVVQWHWFEDTHKGADQFNSIHERLIEAWKGSGVSAKTRLYFTCDTDSEEDWVTTEYLRDTAVQAGLDTAFIALKDIGYREGRFVDLDERPITAMFKLYPWEWLLTDKFGAYVSTARLRVIEPAWKMVLSNKGLLAILWELFPDHPNLLPAAFDQARVRGDVVRKPLLSREGANIAVLAGGREARETPGPYRGPYVYQAALPPPVFDGNHVVIGSWVIASQAAGIGIREDDGPITVNTSRFVPHFFR